MAFPIPQVYGGKFAGLPVVFSGRLPSHRWLFGNYRSTNYVSSVDRLLRFSFSLAGILKFLFFII